MVVWTLVIANNHDSGRCRAIWTLVIADDLLPALHLDRLNSSSGGLWVKVSATNLDRL
jgi:hypothetical protein